MPETYCKYPQEEGGKPIISIKYELEGGKIVGKNDIEGLPSVGEKALLKHSDDNLTVKNIITEICPYFCKHNKCIYNPKPEDKDCPWQETKITNKELVEQERPNVPEIQGLQTFLQGHTDFREFIKDKNEVNMAIKQIMSIMAKYDPSSTKAFDKQPENTTLNALGWIISNKDGKTLGVIRSSLKDPRELHSDAIKIAALNTKVAFGVGEARSMYLRAETRKKIIKSTGIANKIHSYEQKLRSGPRGQIVDMVRSEHPYQESCKDLNDASKRSSMLWNFWESTDKFINALKSKANSLIELKKLGF